MISAKTEMGKLFIRPGTWFCHMPVEDEAIISTLVWVP